MKLRITNCNFPKNYTVFMNLQCNRRRKMTMSNKIARGKHGFAWKPYVFKWTRYLKAYVDEIDTEEKLAFFIYSNLAVEDEINGDTFYVYHRTYHRLPYSKNIQKKAAMHLIAILHLIGTDPFHFTYKFYYINMKRYPFWKGKDKDELGLNKN